MREQPARKHERSNHRSPPIHYLAVYDGMTCAGFLDEGRGVFRAYDAVGKLIGNFKTQCDAVRAIPKVPP